MNEMSFTGYLAYNKVGRENLGSVGTLRDICINKIFVFESKRQSTAHPILP